LSREVHRNKTDNTVFRDLLSQRAHKCLEKFKKLGSFYMRLQNPHRVVKSVGHRATMFLEAVPGCSTQDQSILENKATKQSQTQYWIPPQSWLTTFIRY
jgi:hypothetical protein